MSKAAIGLDKLTDCSDELLGRVEISNKSGELNSARSSRRVAMIAFEKV